MSMMIERSFKSARPLVYRVWTDPKYVALWWGVDGATNPVCEMDVRVGGRWRIDMRTKSGVVYPNGGEFLEVVPNERLVFTDVAVLDSPAWHDAPRGVITHTITFADEGAGTRVRMQLDFASAHDHERLLRAGMKSGLEQGLARLERLLTEEFS